MTVSTLLQHATLGKADHSGTYVSQKASLRLRTPQAVGAVCLVADDARDTQFSQLFPALEARGQHATFAVQTGVLDIAGNGRLTSANVAAMYAAGHEIASHTVSHADFSVVNQATRVLEADNSKATLEAIVGSGNVPTFAYPFGRHTATTDAEIYLRYQRALLALADFDQGTSAYMISEVGGMREMFLIGRTMWNTDTHSDLLASIRRAAHTPTIVVVGLHEIGLTNYTPTEPSVAQMNEALDLALSLGVPLLTIDEAFPRNSLIDGGFEDPALNSWVKSESGGTQIMESILDTPQGGMTGVRSLHLNCNNAAGFVYASQFVPATPGLQYTISGRYRMSSSSGAGSVFVRGQPKDYLGANTATGAWACSALTAGAWTQFVATGTVPSNARGVRVDLVLNALVGDAYFDHVHFGPTDNGIWG